MRRAKDSSPAPAATNYHETNGLALTQAHSFYMSIKLLITLLHSRNVAKSLDFRVFRDDISYETFDFP